VVFYDLFLGVGLIDAAELNKGSQIKVFRLSLEIKILAGADLVVVYGRAP
jgi:hypothetical protein